MKFHTYYMDEAIFDLPTVIKRSKKDLAKVDFDTMVGTGFSGSIVIPALAMAMGKDFVLIRKEGDDSHHGRGRLLGNLGKRWIFVDDFVSSGRTRVRVIQKILDAVADYPGQMPRTTMVGQYLYMGRLVGGETTFEPFDSSWADR